MKRSKPVKIEPKDTFEIAFWGNCVHTYHEEIKHFVYARCMGLIYTYYPDPKYPSINRGGFDLKGKSVLDIGGGPVSMLLKSHNFSRGTVADPILFPQWVQDRYRAANVEYVCTPGEEIGYFGYDEAWLYNVLQHTEDPERVIHNARRAAKVVRLFEWIDIPAHDGHPHMLTEQSLRKWLKTDAGVTQHINDSGCVGRAFFGTFHVRKPR